MPKKTKCPVCDNFLENHSVDEKIDCMDQKLSQKI